MALLALWTALSLGWTDSDERTLAELARVVHLGGLALLALSLLDRRTWRAAAAGLALAGVIVCGAAVASRLAPDAFPVDEIKRGGFRSDRLNYPFWYWNAVAAWGAMALAMALAWSAHARSLLVRIGLRRRDPALRAYGLPELFAGRRGRQCARSHRGHRLRAQPLAHGRPRARRRRRVRPGDPRGQGARGHR